MTNRERIKLLRELKKHPLIVIAEKPKQMEEALNWGIKICDKYESMRVKE